jgi:hypothetical protein
MREDLLVQVEVPSSHPGLAEPGHDLACPPRLRAGKTLVIQQGRLCAARASWSPFGNVHAASPVHSAKPPRSETMRGSPAARSSRATPPDRRLRETLDHATDRVLSQVFQQDVAEAEVRDEPGILGPVRSTDNSAQTG